MQTPPRSQTPSTPARRDLPRRPSAAARRARRRALLRRRLFALALVAAMIGALAALLSGGGSSHATRHRVAAGNRGGGAAPPPARVSTSPAPAPARPRPTAPFAVGLTTVRLVDRTRSIRLPNGAVVPRTLETYVRYPAAGPPGGTDRFDARPARAGGPFPLIIFGHGFDVTPGLYAGLLQAWARAGYVVAAPVFPLANPSAPGGPTEADLPNQPRDMSFLISRMLGADKASSGLLSGLIAPHEIAVAGQSDGGDTALAVAYDPRFRDSRVRAAVILSGAEIPNLSAFTIAPGGPPLLATQGTADPINLPSATSAFYDAAPTPKYLLELPGASHLPPYTTEQPQLGIVERVTVAFLDHYLRHLTRSVAQLLKTGSIPGVATLDADP
jgi:dienelactone hydrolase